MSEFHAPLSSAKLPQALTYIPHCMYGGFSLLPFTFMMTQVKVSGSGPYLTPTAGVCSSIMAENTTLWLMSDIPGSLGQAKREVFYTGKSLHPRADLDMVSSTEEERCLLSPSSENLPFPAPWTLVLVMVLGSASSPSCTPLSLTPQFNFGDHSFALPEWQSPSSSSHLQRDKVIKLGVKSSFSAGRKHHRENTIPEHKGQSGFCTIIMDPFHGLGRAQGY